MAAGQPDGPNWAVAVPGDRLRDPEPAPRTPRVADVSPCPGLGERCISAPSEGLGTLFRRVLHPHVHRLLRPVFRRTRPFPAASCPPPSIAFRWIWPERALSTKCSLFFSCRACSTPVPATKSPLQPSRLQTQSPVQPLHMVHTPRFRRSLEGASRDIPHGRCTPHRRPTAQRGPPSNRRGLLHRAVSWVSRPGDRQRRRPVTPASGHIFGGRHAPPLQAPFQGLNVIGTPLPRACRCHFPRLAMALPSGTHPF